jgi:deoxyadenosine/deoxycytidine kinase
MQQAGYWLEKSKNARDWKGVIDLLIAVVGNSGVGKTTFVKALCAAGGFSSGLEQHGERPFQQRFAQELTRYALTNQVDYMLLRAEQELAIRRGPGIGVVDGGLEQDFHVFTRLFHQNGYLSQAEFELCERQYHFYRELLPPPDLTIWLQAPLEAIIERFTRRQRALQIAQLEDLQQMETLLREWLGAHSPTPLLCMDVTTEELSYPTSVARALQMIDRMADRRSKA